MSIFLSILFWWLVISGTSIILLFAMVMYDRWKYGPLQIVNEEEER